MNWECRNAMRCTTDGCTAKAEIEALREKAEQAVRRQAKVEVLREAADYFALNSWRDPHLKLRSMADELERSKT